MLLVSQARLEHQAALATVDYTQFYGWVQAGKVDRVMLEGQEVTGSLKAAEKSDGRDVTGFHTTLPPQEIGTFYRSSGTSRWTSA